MSPLEAMPGVRTSKRETVHGLVTKNAYEGFVEELTYSLVDCTYSLAV